MVEQVREKARERAVMVEVRFRTAVRGAVTLYHDFVALWPVLLAVCGGDCLLKNSSFKQGYI
jgi:hypothetical protein